MTKYQVGDILSVENQLTDLLNCGPHVVIVDEDYDQKYLMTRVLLGNCIQPPGKYVVVNTEDERILVIKSHEG